MPAPVRSARQQQVGDLLGVGAVGVGARLHARRGDEVGQLADEGLKVRRQPPAQPTAQRA